MGLSPKRKVIRREVVRKAWQSNLHWIKQYGFSEYALEAVCDDSEELRICWCCGDQGYQEVAHIIPHSLGGADTVENRFLLCAECHVASPDCYKSEYFVGYVNRNAGRFSRLIEETLHRASERLLAFLNEHPQLADAVEARPLPSFSESCLYRRTTTHGSSISLSTRLARAEMHVDELIEYARSHLDQENMPTIGNKLA
ncbi:HNH endonuclease [Pseudomonas lijiangensis]|uniref:HNH endonuclease signature motif containing protein n=1 Tax=Pseudomonas lijiangensis TaxID=2995658 RepID=UPI0034D6F410